MNNEPGDNQEKPKEENPLEINPNASLAEKRESEVRQNTGPEQEASGYTIGDKIRFRNITGTRTIEGEIREIVDSGKFKVFDSAEDRFYDINADQIEEKLPTENKPEEPKQDTVASPEKIEFATGKNSETFRMGDKVSWVSAGGFATNTGTVSSFEENNGVIFAHIKPDSDPENEIELHPDLLSPVENGVSLSKSTLVAQPSSAGPEWLEEKFNEAKDWLESKGVKVGMHSYTGELEKWKEKVVGIVDTCKQLDISPVEDLGVYFIATNPDQTDSHFFKDVSTERIINFSIGEFVDQEELAKFIKYWREHKNDQDVKTIFEEQKGYSLRDFYKKEGFGGDSIITQGGLRVSKGDKIKFEDDEKKESEAIVDGFEVDELGGIRCKIRPVKKTITSRLGFSQEIVHPRKIIEVLQNSTKDPATSEPGGQEVDKKKDEVEKNVEPEWRKGSEWQAMAEARNRAVTCRAEYENSLNSAVSEEEKARLKAISDEAALAYGQSRKVAEEKIRTLSLLGIDYDNLSPEEKKKVDSGVKLKIMEEIYIGEMKDFRQAQKDYGKEKKEGGILNSAKEAYAKVLSNKAVKAYLGIKWYYRIPATTLLFTAAGYGLGMAAVGTTMASAAGFAGARMARGALTVAGGSALRGAIHKKGESYEQERKEELKNLSEQNLDELETIRKTREINEKYDKYQKWIKRAKVGSAFGVAGAGMWAGMGSGKAAENVVDVNSPSDTPTGRGFFDRIAESARRFGEPNSKESGALAIGNGPKDLDQAAKNLALEQQQTVRDFIKNFEQPKSSGIQPNLPEDFPRNQHDLNVPDATETQTATQVESVVTTVKVAEGIFDNPGVEEVEVASGDSTWKILERMMDHNDKFKSLSGNAEEILAKKNFVISNLANEAIRNAEKIGLEADGSLNIGDKLNFSSLFTDKAKIDELMEKAENLSSDKVRNILENNAKIAKWVADPTNAGKPLTSDQVAEILAEKVETPKVVEPSSGAYYDDVETKEEAFSGKAETPMSEPNMGIASESSGIPNYNLGVKISEVDAKLESSILRNKFSSESEELQKAVAEIRKKAEELNSLDKNSEEYKAGVAELEQRTEDVEIEVQKLSKQLLQGNKNIQEMAQDLAQGQEKLARDSVRSFVAGSEPSKLSLDLPEDLKTESPQTPNASSNEGLRNVRSFRNDTELIQEIEERINKDLDGIYAKKRLFGGKIHGAKSPEFLEIADKPAGLVMQYVDTPNNTRLDTKTIDLIEQNSKHKKFIKMILGLRDQVGRVKGVDSEDLKPFDNENMQSYYRRLGEIMLKSNKPK